MDTPRSLPVTVGWDESPGARAALVWAATTAHRTGAPLRVVLNIDLQTRSGLPTADLGAEEEEITGSLDRARDLVARVSPDVQIGTALLTGHVVGNLMEESRRSRMLVVGSRGHSRFVSALIGSVSDAVASHSYCPVVVVRGETSYPRSAPVVVGADGSQTSREAVRFAAAHAWACGSRLIAVNATAAHQMVAPELIIDEVANEAIREEAMRFMCESLAGVSHDYPDLQVEEIVSDRPAAQALVDAATVAGAQLLVVGSHGRGGFAGMLLGSVSRTVLHHAPGPVAVVRPQDD